MNIALLTASPHVSLAQLEAWAPAFAAHGADIARVWSPVLPEVVAPTVRAVAHATDLTDDDVPVLFVATLPTVAMASGFLAYHYIEDVVVYAIVLADAGKSIDDITIAASHELELLVDPTCDRYFGDLAAEISDPVQTNTIARNGVMCGAFVTPAWFGLERSLVRVVSDQDIWLGEGELAPGGYIDRRDGSRVPPGYVQADSKRHPLSRAARRKRARG